MTRRLPNAERAVVFDLDETLHRLRRFTVGGYAHVSRSLAAETGGDTTTIFRRLWGLYRQGKAAAAYQTICSELGLPTERASELLRRHRAHPARLRLTRSATDALQAMRSSWRIGILTNGLPELQRIKVAALGLEQSTDAIVYADELVPGGKPAAEAFAAICRQLGVPAGRSVMVGDDAAADTEGGHAAGMHTIWVRRPNRTAPRVETAGAIVDSLSEVPEVAARLVT